VSYDIYLCGECLDPIWFPFGDKTHLGTGWNCWKTQQEREEEGLEILDVRGLTKTREWIRFARGAVRKARKR
jgi:hypothetical protein